jgi:hypothetical protein
VQSSSHAGVVVAFFALFFAGVASAQSFQTGVTYVCNGERMLVESCNMRDVSDTSSCLVQHPDRPLHNGFVAYTNETRGTLNKLVSTCQQPSGAEIAHAQAFAKKQQDKQDAILQKNLAAMDAPAPAPSTPSGSVKSQRDKARLARCISAGKTEGQCVGNEFGKAFEGVFAFAGSMLGMSGPQPGIYLNGVYEGKGGWNINFLPDSALVQCSDLVGRDQTYKLEFKGSQAVVHLENKPEPLVLNYRDGKLYGSTAVQVAGDIVVGTVGGTGGGGSQAPQGMTANTSTQTTSREISGMEAEAYQRGGGTGTLQQSGPGYTLSETTTTTTYSAAPAPTPTYNTGPRIITAPRTRTCAAPILATSKTTGSGDMGNAVSGLGAMLGGEGATKAVTAPTGLRMLGEFAAPSGADIDFHDDSAIVACGLIAAQYPYTVEISGGQPVLKLSSAGKPTISLTVGADRTLTGSGDLQVTGRVAMGEDRDGNITYTSRSVSCTLGTLKPATENSTDGLTTPAPVALSKTPSNAPSGAPVASASNSTGTAAAKPAGPVFAKPGAPTGNAVLTVVSGFPVQAGAPSLLGGRPYLLLRDNLGTALVKAGASVPAGVSPHRAVKEACEQKTPDCRQYLLAISADAATGLAADASGKATLPGVPPGIYFLVVSNQNNTIYWEMKLALKSGTNTASLDQHNAVPMQ